MNRPAKTEEMVARFIEYERRTGLPRHEALDRFAQLRGLDRAARFALLNGLALQRIRRAASRSVECR